MKKKLVTVLLGFALVFGAMGVIGCVYTPPLENSTQSSEHTHVYGEWEKDENADTHSKIICSCGEKVTAVCSGGTANCKEKAVCVTCNSPYGDLNLKNHEKNPKYVNMGENTHKILYECCGVEENENHEMVKRECQYCEYKMPTIGLAYELNESAQSYSVIGIGEAIDDDIVIPSAYNNLPVVSIDERAFDNCNNIESIIIPNSVTTIGAYAFTYCERLIKVKLSDNITFIDEGTFSGCSRLMEVVIPKNVVSIGAYCFSDCISLTDITIPDSVTLIQGGAFSYCENLKNVSISNSVISIGEWAFIDCKSLTDIVIPEGVFSICEAAFSGCEELKSVKIPSSVSLIEREVFFNCKNLKNIDVNENNKVYKDINGNLYTKDGKTLIQYAIGKSSTEFIIPDTVISIGEMAFYNCTELISVDIPNSVELIEEYAFYACDSLISVIIPEGASIGVRAFSCCNSLTDIVIPEKVTSIGSGAFSYCDKLINITVNENNKKYKDINGDLYTKDGETLIQYASGKTNEKFIVPDSVLLIGDSAFAGCDNLLNIQMSDNVNCIGNSAFSGCNNLEEVILSNNIGSINNSAFYGCISLKTISIPDSVEVIGENVFGNCANLEKVIFEENSRLEVVNRQAFSNCVNLSDIKIPEGVTILERQAFYNCSSLKNIILPDNLECIDTLAFASCSGITSILIPKTVTYVGDGAFLRCDNLTVYCETENLPSGWEKEWNYSNCPVIWDCKNK